MTTTDVLHSSCKLLQQTMVCRQKCNKWNKLCSKNGTNRTNYVAKMQQMEKLCRQKCTLEVNRTALQMTIIIHVQYSHVQTTEVLVTAISNSWLTRDQFVPLVGMS